MIMQSKLRLLFLVFLASVIIPSNWAIAVEKQSQKSREKLCERVVNLPFPAEDRPSPEIANTLDKCSSYELYYGFDQPANPEGARLCAYDEIDKSREDGPFGGKAILMTIYANGVGAMRNFDLAIKLACQIDGAPAELDGRVKHLEELKEQNWHGNNFSLCDDVTSGLMTGFCADHANMFASRIRTNKVHEIQAKWTSADRDEYAILRKISGQYFDIHAEYEVDQSGSARMAYSIYDKSSQEEDFIKTLELLEQGRLPKYSNQQLKEADSKMNSIYRKIQKLNEPEPEWGTVTKESIKNTQRGWLKHRDAWVKFCRIKYPKCTTDSIKAYLTLKRTKELEEFLN